MRELPGLNKEYFKRLNKRELLITPQRKVRLQLGKQMKEDYQEGGYRTEEKGNSAGWAKSEESSGFGLRDNLLTDLPYRLFLFTRPQCISLQFYLLKCSAVMLLPCSKLHTHFVLPTLIGEGLLTRPFVALNYVVPT